MYLSCIDSYYQSEGKVFKLQSQYTRDSCIYFDTCIAFMQSLDLVAKEKKKPRSAIYNNGYLCRILCHLAVVQHFAVVTRDFSFDRISR